MTRLRLPFLAAAALLLSFGCQNFKGFLPESFLVNEAQLQFAALKEQAPVSTNPEYKARVDRIGARLVAAAAERLPGDYQWEFVVFEEPSVNAFAMPGGKVGVHTGLIQLVENDDQLASVLAHEVAHVMEQHANARMSLIYLSAFGSAAVAVAANQQERIDPALIMAAYGVGSTLGIQGYGRSQEYEADVEGLYLMAEAGYDPRAAIAFWEKMQAASSDGQPLEIFSSHPNHGNRIARLEAALPEALALYEATR